jgi:hypothetical protein
MVNKEGIEKYFLNTMKHIYHKTIVNIITNGKIQMAFY